MASEGVMARSTETGDGEVAFVAAIFLAAAAGFTFVITQDINRSDCQDYGKTRIFGKLYECKPVDAKK